MAKGYRFEVLADRIDMPVMHIVCRVDVGPCLPNESGKRAATLAYRSGVALGLRNFSLL